MEHQEQILFRKLLKKNGFNKNKYEDKSIMEFEKGDSETKNYFLVYTYDEVEVFAGSGLMDQFTIPNIEKFKEIYKEYSGTEFLT